MIPGVLEDVALVPRHERHRLGDIERRAAAEADHAVGLVCLEGPRAFFHLPARRVAGDAEVTFAVDALDLVEGTYKVDVAVHKRDGYPYDYHRLLYTFRVKSRTHDVGIYRPRHRWMFSPNVRFDTR